MGYDEDSANYRLKSIAEKLERIAVALEELLNSNKAVCGKWFYGNGELPGYRCELPQGHDGPCGRR
jgi:hypothetical protein